MTMTSEVQLSQLRELFVKSVNGEIDSEYLIQNTAGILLREIRTGRFQEWARSVNHLGPTSIFTNTVEVVDEFDAISVHEIRFGNHVEGETLVLGYHLYPEGEWKLWTASTMRPLSATDVSAAD